MPGAGNTGSQGNIKVYQNWDQGIDATIRTLKNGRYGAILQALKGNDPLAVGRAIESSPWGTGGLALKTIPRAPGHPLGSIPNAGGGVAKATAAASAPTASPNAPSPVSKLIDVIQTMNASQRPKTEMGAAPQGNDTLSLARAANQRLQQQQDQTLEMIKRLGKGFEDTNADTWSQSTPGTMVEAAAGGPDGEGAEAAIGWAKSKLGFKETGTNAGGIASYLNKQFGMSGAPWCAMFTSAAVTKGGAPSSARTASVAQVRALADAGQGYRNGVFSGGKARRGDLIMWGNDHIALVTGVKDGKISYVGGNQSNGVTNGSVNAGSVDAVRPLYGARRRG
jgi:hypothetical protein